MKCKIIIITLAIIFISSLLNSSAVAQTSDEINELKKAELPVILPTYLPRGFQLVYFGSKVQYFPTENYDYAGVYSAIYQGPNNVCFRVEGNSGPVGDAWTTVRQWTVNTRFFGQLILEEATDMSGIGNQTWLQVDKFFSYIGHGVLFNLYSPSSRLNPDCNEITVKEAIKILQSLQIIEY